MEKTFELDMDVTKELYDTISIQVDTLCTLIRDKDFAVYQENSMNNTYNSQPMLKKLQALKNSLEDVKQYAYGYAYESEN